MCRAVCKAALLYRLVLCRVAERVDELLARRLVFAVLFSDANRSKLGPVRLFEAVVCRNTDASQDS